jgi:hypothetical protein
MKKCNLILTPLPPPSIWREKQPNKNVLLTHTHTPTMATKANKQKQQQSEETRPK